MSEHNHLGEPSYTALNVRDDVSSVNKIRGDEIHTGEHARAARKDGEGVNIAMVIWRRITGLFDSCGGCFCGLSVCDDLQEKYEADGEDLQ